MTLAVATTVPDPAAGATPAPGAAARPGVPLAPGGDNWTRLKFETSNAVASAETDIVLSVVDSEQFRDLAAQAPTRIEPAGPEVVEVSISTVFDLPIVGKRRSFISAWFDQSTAAVLQRVNERRGRKPKHKVTRFGHQGLFISRANPASSSERGEPPADWSIRDEDFVSYSAAQDQCEIVSDFAALLLLVSRPQVTQQDAEADICVVDNNELFRVVVREVGSEQMEASYVAHIGPHSTELSGDRDMVHVVVRGESIETGSSETAEFLGLRGDIDIYLDARTRMPLQVSGSVPVFGRIDFRMVEAWIEPGKNNYATH